MTRDTVLPRFWPARRGGSRVVWFLGVLVVLVCVWSGLGVGAAVAAEERGHVFGGSFAGEGSLAGELSEPDGMAVSEASGDVYVADAGNRRVEVFSSSGAYVGGFDGDGSSEFGGKTLSGPAVPQGRMAEPTWVTVDNYCVVNDVAEPECRAQDPSAGDVYVLDEGAEVVDKFSPEGVYLGQISETAGKETAPGVFEKVRFAPAGVAVGRGGEVWVYEYSPERRNPGAIGEFSDGVSNVYEKSLYPLVGMGLSGAGGGLATDVQGNFFVKVTLAGMKELNSKGEVVRERLEGNASETPYYGFAAEARTGGLYLSDGEKSIERLDKKMGLVEDLVGGNLVSARGVAVDEESGQVYVDDHSLGVVDEFSLEPAGPPSVGGGYVADVTGDSAVVSAVVRPHGAETGYSVEYGRCVSRAACATSGYEPASAAGVLEGDFEAHQVSVSLQGLEPGAVYHVRVHVSNSFSPEGGEDGTELVFSTQGVAGSGLIDGRVWEMVSPPQKYGARLLPIAEAGLAQAAADGEAIAYSASAPTEAQPTGNSNVTQVLSRRTPSGWVSQDLTIPHERATGFSGEGEVRFFTTNLETSILQPFGKYDSSLAKNDSGQTESSEQTAYLRSDFAGSDWCTSECFTPLVVGCPEAGEPCPEAVQHLANVPEGTVFGEETGICPPKVICGPEFVDATSAGRYVVLSSEPALVEEQPAAKDGLYEWSEGKLQLVSVLPDGEPSMCFAKSGKPCEKTVVQPQIGGNGVARGAISSGGEMIDWTGGGHLYVSDVVTGQTLQVDAVSGGSGLGAVAPQFEYASENGRTILFKDSQALTEHAGISDDGEDLYRCEVEEEEDGHLKCDLRDLTPDTLGEAMHVQGAVLGVSRDLSTIYFVADGAVAGSGARPGDCNSPFTNVERCNLYVYRDGGVHYIAELSGLDAGDWAQGGDELNALTASVTPSGEWLAFMSERSLTGYDNQDINSGQADEEVYLYHAGDEKLRCVSCNPTGARPAGVEYEKLATGNGGLAGGDRVWQGNQWIAGNIPGWVPYRLGTALYQPRYLDESGRMFFQSADALSTKDVNGTEDVYEFEPAGVGSCSTEASDYAESTEGCIGLISSGTSSEESAFLDASENGDDVFFLTTARLSPKDKDSALDVYDARVGGSESETPAPVECQGDACQASVTPPESLTPGSSTYRGPGNPTTATATTTSPSSTVKPKSKPLTRAQKLAKALKACPEKPKRTRARCERSARKKYGSGDAARGKKRPPGKRGRASGVVAGGFVNTKRGV